MSLVSILIFAVSALAIMSGLAGFIGASKNDRKHMVWFLLMTVFASIWAGSCVLFLNLPTDALEYEVIVLRTGIYYGGALMMLALMVFCIWDFKWGKALTLLGLSFVAAFLSLLTVEPGIMFDGYSLETQGNRIILVQGAAYLAYFLYYAVGTISCCWATYKKARRARLTSARKGNVVLLVGLVTTSVFSVLFNVIFPISLTYSLIWIGPFSLMATMITFYFALLKYRMVSLNSRWLKIFSSVVIMLSGVMIYMLLFYLIFTALFKIPNPSPAILALNFLMIVIVLLLMPVISEISAMVRSMISVGQVNLSYVVKKLNRLATRNVDLRELAGFLADHMHFDYVGFIINERVYGSKQVAITGAEVARIARLRQNKSEMWQEPTEAVQKIMNEYGLKAMAPLRNAKGQTFGQMVVGRPLGKSSFEQRDLVQMEAILNLVAMVIDSEKHLRA